MKNFHVNPDESVMIHQDVKCRKSVGIHWGTFLLSTEPFDAPPKLLKQALIKNNIGIDEFITPEIGKIIELEKSD